MLEQKEDVEAKVVELRKTIQSQRICAVGTTLGIAATIVLFFIPSLRSWEVIIPTGIVTLTTPAVLQSSSKLHRNYQENWR